MPVLIEAICVVVRRDLIERKFPGGWAAFVLGVPNRQLCTDGKLARVSFMTPADAGAFVRSLEQRGFTFVRNNMAVDIGVVDQRGGPTGSTPWIEFGKLKADSGQVSACWLAGDAAREVAVPKDWRFEGSMSQKHLFVPTREAEQRMQFLRNEGGVEVYRDAKTGREVFIGRAGEMVSPDQDGLN